MADSTDTISRKFKDAIHANRIEAKIKTSEVMVKGGLAGILNSTGLLENGDDTAGLIPVGYLEQPSSAAGTLTGDGTVKAVAVAGQVLENQTVTGVSAITDTLKYVYCTDNQTFTLTKPSAGYPIGFILKWRATTYCDIALFSIEGAVLNAAAAVVKETVNLGTISTTVLEGTSAADLLKWTAQRRCKITALRAYCTGIDSGSVAGAQDLNLEIGTTDLTGGVLSLAYTDNDAIGDVGTAIAATAITAANECAASDVVTLELAASGTGFTAAKQGQFKIEMDVEYLGL